MSQISIVSRSQAKLAGLTRYFTGKRCRLGHLDYRNTASAVCATCANERSAAYYEKHKAERDEKSRTYYSKNKGKRSDKAHAYYLRNKRAILAKGKARRLERLATDPEYRLRETRQYRILNPDVHRRFTLMGSARRHAKEDGVRLDFDAPYLEALLQAALDRGIVVSVPHRPNTASLDKIDVTKPISRQNIQVVPWWYNRAKLRWTEADLHSAMAAFGFKREFT